MSARRSHVRARTPASSGAEPPCLGAAPRRGVELLLLVPMNPCGAHDQKVWEETAPASLSALAHSSAGARSPAPQAVPLGQDPAHAPGWLTLLKLLTRKLRCLSWHPDAGVPLVRVCFPLCTCRVSRHLRGPQRYPCRSARSLCPWARGRSWSHWTPRLPPGGPGALLTPTAVTCPSAHRPQRGPSRNFGPNRPDQAEVPARW